MTVSSNCSKLKHFPFSLEYVVEWVNKPNKGQYLELSQDMQQATVSPIRSILPLPIFIITFWASSHISNLW